MKINQQIKQLKTERQEFQETIDKVLAKRSTGSRARAAYDLWLELNPMVPVSFSDGTSGWLPAKRVHALTIEKVKLLKGMQNNRHGASESGSMRAGLEMPPAAMNFLQMFHPDIFDDDDQAKNRFHKLIKVFPEFLVRESI